MKTHKAVTLALLVLAFGSQDVSATQIDLFDWAFHIDGSHFYKPQFGPVNDVGFDDKTGLGYLTWETSQAGAHTFLAAFDHDIEGSGNTFFDESGSAHGIAAAGQTWEIDEPGYWYVYGNATGDIHNNFLGGYLDNTVFNATNIAQEDASMGMGWNFNLASSQTAAITLTLSEYMPNSGFYLQQYDNPSGTSIYLSSTLTITSDDPGPVNPIPEPGTMLLFGTGLACIAGFTRKMSIWS